MSARYNVAWLCEAFLADGRPGGAYLRRAIRRGWKLGGEDFLDWILDKMQVSTKEAHPSHERDETEQTKAWRIVREELKSAIQTLRMNPSMSPELCNSRCKTQHRAPVVDI